MSTDVLLEELASCRYPGRVALIMMQFPTPHRLSTGTDSNEALGAGNRHLPFDSLNGFMAALATLEKISLVIERDRGRFLLQSNCEDIAVQTKQRAVSLGLACVPMLSPVLSIDGTQPLTERTKRWMEQQNDRLSRARGPEWSAVPLLPPGCVSETEIACQFNSIPVHRCLFSTVGQ